MMTPEESDAWHPEIQGWSTDILPWYEEKIKELPVNALVAEVGIYHGRSLLFFSETLVRLGREDIRIYGIDPLVWNPEDWQTLLYNMTNLSNRALQRISIIRMTSIRSSAMFQHEDLLLDMVFLDAEHDYKSVNEDISHWSHKIKTGGIIAGHDYGDSTWPDVKRAVDSWFSPDPERDNLHITGTVWEARI
jgi:cephalosporin hydroxylase